MYMSCKGVNQVQFKIPIRVTDKLRLQWIANVTWIPKSSEQYRQCKEKFFALMKYGPDEYILEEDPRDKTK